jgi:flagellar assembly factor FliW
MRCAEASEPEVVAVQHENIIRMPLGLLGFEHIKEYVLLANPDEAPFLWLQVLADPSLAFLAISPFIVLSDYAPDLGPEDADFLELTQPHDALVFNIVTLRPGGRATVNLRGPVVVNRRTLLGRQVIPLNAAEYDLRHPLPIF